MFSLIITIVSIALVAALALAALYYGGPAVLRGQADAQATRVLLHGQQLTAAADLYRADHGQYPLNIQAMVDGGYLRMVPVALEGSLMNTAWAGDEAWFMPKPGVPVFVLPDVEAQSCTRINLRSYSQDGILPQVNDSLSVQCYGPTTATADLKTVVAKSATYLRMAFDNTAMPSADLYAAQTAIPDASDTEAWTAPPGVKVTSTESPAPADPIEVWSDVDASPVTSLFMPVGNYTNWTLTRTLMVVNRSGAPWTVQSIALSNDSLGFSLQSTCDAADVVQDGETCSATVTFAPQNPMAYSMETRLVNLVIQTSAGTHTVALEGYINPLD